MRWLLISLLSSLLIGGMAYSQEPSPKSHNSKKSAKTDQRGTAKAPLIVEVLPSKDAEKEAAENAAERKEKLQLDRNLVKFTQDLRDLTGVLAAIGAFQLVVFGYQAWKLRQTVEAADIQGADMKASVAEAKRAATAMDEVAKATRANADRMEGVLHRQMRAYVAVNTGKPTFQDKHNRFAGEIVLENTGFTPARNLTYKIKAGIFAGEPKSFPDNPKIISNDMGLAPRQQLRVQDIVPERFTDEEVKEIMMGGSRRLFVWGTVTYDDIDGKAWETNFCHNYAWVFDEKGEIVNRFDYYFHKYNSAT